MVLRVPTRRASAIRLMSAMGGKLTFACRGGSLHHCLMQRAIFSCLTAVVLTACSETEAPESCVPVLPGWSSEQTGKPVSTMENRVTLSGRQILWNGHPTDERDFKRLVEEVAVMNPIPFMIFDPGVAPDCSFARHVRDTLDKELPCRDGACWQGSKEAYDRAPFKKLTGTGIP